LPVSTSATQIVAWATCFSAIARGLRHDGLGLIGICIAPAGGGGVLTDVSYWAAIVTHASQAILSRGLAPVLLPHSVEMLNKFARASGRRDRRRPSWKRPRAWAATFTIDQALGKMSCFAAAPTGDRWLIDRAGFGFARCFESFG
jgi:hypothetical protein